MYKILGWFLKRLTTKINPLEISGNWYKGFALDLHTLKSIFVGYNEVCHEVYDTTRSEVGELLYRLKYRLDKSVLHNIVKTSVNFLKHEWKIVNILDGIVPIPPSDIHRVFQPVLEIAKGISYKLQIPLYSNSLSKIKETPELKDVLDYNERYNILKDIFVVDDSVINGKNILLFDDLYRSGATLTVATNALYQQGKAINVYALVLTRTRSKT